MFKKLAIIVFFFFVLYVYLHNLTRDIYGGDVGDLVTAAYVFGVPHPPGYPLFTFLGHVLSRLPLNLPVVSKVGLISVASSLGALFFFYKFSYSASKNFLISILSTSILAFSHLFWFYSELPEVFALNNFFAIILFYLVLQYYKSRKIKYLYLLFFFLGLSLTNQHTILLTFPAIGLILLYSKIVKKLLDNRKKIIYLISLFFLGLLPYLYIPIAASRSPVVNWDKASNLTNFVRLVLRKDYGTFDMGVDPLPTPVRQYLMRDYFYSLTGSLSIVVLIICFFGALFLYKKDRKLLTSILVGFLFAGPIFIIYAGIPIVNRFVLGVSERFYLLSMVILLFLLPYGFVFIKELFLLFFSKKAYVTLVMIEFFILPLFLFRYNFPRTDLSSTQIGNNFASDILNSLPKNAALFLTGDTATFNIWYTQQVLNKRKDIIAVHVGGAGNDSFLLELKRRHLKKNPKAKDKEIATGILNEAKRTRWVFSLSPIEIASKNMIWIPKGLAYELVEEKDIPVKEDYLKLINSQWLSYNVPRRKELSIAERNFTSSFLPMDYSLMMKSTGDFLLSQYQDSRRALEFYQKALQIDDENIGLYHNLGTLQYLVSKDCNGAEENFNKAISNSPFSKNYYLSLYIVYKECKKDQEAILDLKKRYKELFKESIDEEIAKKTLDLTKKRGQ